MSCAWRYVHVVQSGRVQAEDSRLVVFAKLGVAELLANLVGNLESLESVDHPLRRAPPEAIGAPNDMVGAVVFDVLADQVHGHLGVCKCQRAEGRPDLRVDVGYL